MVFRGLHFHKKTCKSLKLKILKATGVKRHLKEGQDGQEHKL